MSEIINSTYLTLDGVIEHPETWPDPGGFDPEGNKIQTDLDGAPGSADTG